MRFLTSEIAAVTGGVLRGSDVSCAGATIDSRTVAGGELFVAVIAARDGHEFVPGALTAGAAAALTSRGGFDGTHVEVADTTAALAALGRAARDRIADRVVGITGSVGKTSTKDLLASVLAQCHATAASERSFNNELGVPLTLLNAPDGCEAAVVEMGARGPGHIAMLCEVARPTVGVVTVVAAAHTEFFGDVDGVARGKGELIEALPPSGTAVLNADDPRVLAMRERTGAAVLTFGTGGDVRAEGVTVDPELRPSFRLLTPAGEADVRLEVRGAHQVANALAAAAAASACGIPLEAITAGLGEARLSPWRMQLARSASGAWVLNDAYNANPTSTAAALRALAGLDAHRRIAVLGPMAELGNASDGEHEAVARLATSLGIEVIAVAAPAYGGEVVPDARTARDRMGPLRDGDAVLVKGSRVAGLEKLAAELLGTGN